MEMAIKQEDGIEGVDAKNTTNDSNYNSESTIDNEVPNSSKDLQNTSPLKKRRRSGKTSQPQAKTKASSSKDSSTNKSKDKQENAPKKQEDAETKGSKGKRGPTVIFTPEQDAYIIHLRQSTSSAQEIWKKFEDKFHTGNSEKAIKNRLFSIKDSVLLSGEEDALLNETIEEGMGDLAATIVDRFAAKSGGKKVTKAFVQKRIKQIGPSRGKAKQGKPKDDMKDG
ncbi:hypothetical protein ABW19_dt0206435 [Dactylella cylindrospora]|nr:hypothetical protein ABW19_dt0206435 [Dactylella cylindrospora]